MKKRPCERDSFVRLFCLWTELMGAYKQGIDGSEIIEVNSSYAY
jgi:hypothetical protein